MCFDKIRLGAQQPLAALGRLIKPARSQQRKSFSERFLHPRRCFNI
jgi:hypothetical protein